MKDNTKDNTKDETTCTDAVVSSFSVGRSFSLLLTGYGGGGKRFPEILGCEYAGWLESGFLIREDLREKYGMPELKTVADVEKFLYIVKEKETTVKPFDIGGRKADRLALIFNNNVNTSKDNDLETTVSMFYYSLSDKKSCRSLGCQIVESASGTGNEVL